jgi:7-keto-8-aminopelargonate synthetase-like enzyme
MADLFSKFDPLIEQREALLSTGLTDPFNLVMERVESPTVAICNGRRTILLGTYNYMGMTFDPDVVAAGKRALDEFGSGTTGSRVLNGTYQGHKECEAALKDFYAMDHAMVFSTGYQANLGVISTIAGKDDYIILDIDSHASIYDGCALGNAQIVPFRHNDVEALENRLRRLPPDAGKLVVLEGVYSMLGDVAPLDKMVPIAKSFGAMVLVDEAHSMGFIGTNGRGVAEPKASSTRSTSSSAPFPSRSARSAASASPTIRSSKSSAWSAGPMSSPPRCRRASSPPPPPRSAS